MTIEQHSSKKVQQAILIFLLALNAIFALYQQIEAAYVAFFLEITVHDYASFYTGWSMIREGLWEQVYTIDAQVNYHQQLFGTVAPLYVHPPHSAAPFVWLSTLTYFTSNLIWVVINYLALTMLMWQLWREFISTWKISEKWGFFVIFLAFPALQVNILVANMAPLIALIVLNVFLQIQRGHVVWVGVLLFLGTIKYQLFIVLGLYLLGARWWKSVLLGLTLMFSAWIVSSLLMGWDIWTSYATFLQEFSFLWDQHGINPQDGYNLRAFLAIILGQSYQGLINTVSLLILALSGLTAFIFGRRASLDNQQWSISFILVLALYTSPHLYIYDLVLLSIVGAYFYNYLRQTSFQEFPLYITLLCLPIVMNIIVFSLGTETVATLFIQSLFLMPILIYMWFHRSKTYVEK